MLDKTCALILQELDKKERKKSMDSLGTVRLVARLSGRCWRETERIFSLYRNGNIKGQKKLKEELGMPDCKKCNWQFLHGLTEEQQFTLLSDLASKKIAFAEVNAKATTLKKEEKVTSVWLISYSYLSFQFNITGATGVGENIR